VADGAEPRPLPPDLPVVDHHCHLSPNGEGIRAAARFAAAGGTHLFLATQSYGPGPILALPGYVDQFDTTEALARRVGEETSATGYAVLAPYPIDLLAARQSLGLEGAIQLQMEALDEAGRRVRDHRAVALGEVGRPHFPVEEEKVREASERVFDYAMAVAHDADCPAIVHCEDLSAEGYLDLMARARRAGLRPERIVKHYARARFFAPGEIPVRSYLARRELISEVLDDPGPWFWETDFLDAPSRAGAVLDIATVPKRAKWVAAHLPEKVERLRVPFEEAVRKVYGLSLRSSAPQR
jgi:TatD-related deoxyribonuclease